MPIARLADFDDLTMLLDLMPHGNPLMPKLSDETAHHIWVEIISRSDVFCFRTRRRAEDRRQLHVDGTN